MPKLKQYMRFHKNQRKDINMQPLTREQEDWICYQIGEWYLQWKDNIVDHHCKEKFDCSCRYHKLGYAKELLKERLCLMA